MKFCHVYNTISNEKDYFDMPEGSSPSDYMDLKKIEEFDNPTVCTIVRNNGYPKFIGRSDWGKPVPKDHMCVFVSYPREGVTIALFVISIIVTIYALSQTPDIPENQKTLEQSPTYALSGLKNQIRLNQPIPVQYGRIRAYPDVASHYYVEHRERDTTEYNITYDGNGHTGGTVPTDAVNYLDNQSATVLTNSGSLVKTANTFNGWNTDAGGTGVQYAEDTLYTIGNANITLYAQWTASTTYTITYDANGSTGGSIPTDANNYLNGDTVFARENSGTLIKTSNKFNGWNTLASGLGTDYKTIAEFAIGAANVTLYAKWVTTALERLVTYDGGSNTGGAIPLDTNIYQTSDTAIVRENSGILTRTGLDFKGWVSGSGEFYSPGDTFVLESTSVTLTARWSTLPSVLNGRLCIGHGKFETTVDDIRIDDTPFSDFNNQNINILHPGDSPSIFTNDVNTAKETGNVVIDEVAPTNYGPYIVNDISFVADTIICDIEFRRGLYTSDNNGNLTSKSVNTNITIQEIDINGDPVDATVLVVAQTTTASTRDVVRDSIVATPANPGRYKVIVRRNTTTSVDPKIVDEVTIVRIKAVRSTAIPANNNYTFIEFDIESSNQLNNQNSDIMNIEATRKITTYDSLGTPTLDDPSSSPVWAFYDMVLNSVYGAALDSDRIDLQHLVELDQHLRDITLVDEPPIECNVRFDVSASGDDLFAQIAQSCRCQVFQRSGKKWMVRDEYREAITAFFTEDNINEGSLNVNWIPRGEFSSVYYEISYFDETSHQLETVNCVWYGETIDSTSKKEPVRLYAVTNRTRAWKEGMFLLAQDKLRRKIVTFETDMEGYIPSVLDKISLTHENLSDEISGTVQRIDGSAVYLSEPVAFDGAMTGQIAFKDLDGTLQGPFTVTQGSNQYNVRLVDWNPANANIISQEDESPSEATRFTFGLTEQSALIIVKKIATSGDNKVSIEGAVENNLVHSSDWDTSFIPDYGELYVAGDEKYFYDVTTTTDISTPTAPDVTTTFEGSGYAQFKLQYTYIVAGVETIDNEVHNLVTPGTQTFNYLPAHGSEVPVKCTVTPSVISFAQQIDLDPLETNSPLYVTE